MKYILALLLSLPYFIKANGADTASAKYHTLKSTNDKLEFLYLLSANAIYKSKAGNKAFLRSEIAKIHAKTETEMGMAELIKGNIIYLEDSVVQIKDHFRRSYTYLKTHTGKKEYFYILNALGNLYFELGQKDSALYYRTQALETALKNKSNIAFAYFKLGEHFYYFSNITDAINTFKKAAEEGIKTGDFENTALAFKFLSLIYRDQKTFDYMSLCDTSLYYAKKTNDPVQITEAIYYKLQCLVLKNQHEKAKQELNTIEQYFRKASENVLLQINFNKAAAFYYSETGDVKKTIAYLQKNNALSGFISRKSGKTGRAYNNLGNACIDDKQYALAVRYLDTAIYYGQKYNDQTLLWFAYDNIVRAYHGLNDYKNEAFYFRKLWDINDSILKIENQSKIAEFETKLNVEKKNISIKNLNTQKALDQITISNYKKTQIIYYFIAFILIIILIGTILFFRQKNKTQKLLAEQSNEITRLQTQMTPHFIFNALTSLQSFVLKDEKQKAVSSISQLAKLMRSTLANSEQNYISIDKELQYLNMYIDFENQRNNEKISFITDIEDVIETDSPCIPPMLIQPLIENSIKHAFTNNATEKVITLTMRLLKSKDQALLKIQVTDNGIGFETKENNGHQSRALEICRKRVINLYRNKRSSPANTFSVKNLNSETRTGTQITLTIPYL